MELLGNLHGYPVYYLSDEERADIYKKSGKMHTFAFCRRVKHEIFVFDEMSHFTEREVLFILLHEVGHMALKTSDEDACDRFAMSFFPDGEQLLGRCNATTACVKPLVVQDLIRKGFLPKTYKVRSRRY